MTLAEMNNELGAAGTNKKEFLKKPERIISWMAFLKIIQPKCHRTY